MQVLSSLLDSPISDEAIAKPVNTENQMKRLSARRVGSFFTLAKK